MERNRFLQLLDQHVAMARTKHPGFKKTRLGIAAILIEEVAELCWAMAFESRQRVVSEAMDIVAICYRIVAGDGKK